jgi:hypothetical protein
VTRTLISARITLIFLLGDQSVTANFEYMLSKKERKTVDLPGMKMRRGRNIASTPEL